MTIEVAPWLTDSCWPTIPIRYVARLGTGHTPSRQHPEYWENCTVPWVTLADVKQLRDGRTQVITQTEEKISPLGIANSSAVRHPAGTLILSRTASVGYSAILGTEMATSQDFATWVCSEKINPKFLLHSLRAMAPDLRRVAMGSTHKTVYMPDIASLRVTLPPLEEQRRIADFLDAETAHIDDLDDLRRRQISVMEERQQRALSDEFEGLVDTPRPRLGYLCRIQTGITVDGSRTGDESWVTRPYLRVANVQVGRLNLDTVHEITVPRSLAAGSTLRKGDVLMTEGGDLDKLGRGTVWNGEIAECLHQNHVFALRVAEGKLVPAFLALYTQTLAARMHFESTGNKTTNLASTSSSKIRDLRIPMPLLQQQLSVITTISAMTEATERALEALRRQRSLLGERRQALITAAVTGQLDVTTSRGADLS